MIIKNKYIVECLHYLRNGLNYLSDSIGKMYEETDSSIHVLNIGKDDTYSTPGLIYSNVCQLDEDKGEKTDSLSLDRGKADFKRLLSESSNMIKYYDRLSTDWSQDQQMIVADMSLKIIESMILSGCNAIEGDSVYDMKRHQVKPYRLIPNGTPIKGTIRIGAEWNGTVYVPAIVCV